MWRGMVMAVAAMAAALAAASGPAGSTPAKQRSVAIFYYPWYGTPVRDGAWQHWDQRGATPPLQVASNFFPTRGAYSSTDPRVVREHMREIAGLGVDTLVVSWWGPNSTEDSRLAGVATAARKAGLRVAIHVEPWAGRTAAAVRTSINELRALQIRDFYVYDSTMTADTEWAAALLGIDDDTHVYANTWLPGKAISGGFQGLYSYDIAIYRAETYRRTCKSARRHGLLCAPSVGPGFDATRATSMIDVVDRRNGNRYDHMWQSVIGADADVVAITSYNEWHEGTQIEAARSVEGYASYEGAWGLTGLRAQRAYVDRTRYWVDRYRRR
jgi:glycoprotein endo-alpha-1,2-mannosidase